MALGDKLPVVMGKEKAVANGVATLDADGKLAESQRPTPTEAGSADLTLSNLSNYQTALRNIGGRPNSNLLDNAYFKGGGSQQGGGQFPINQRGQTSYSENGYCIDRWRIGSSGTLTISADYIEFVSSDTTGRNLEQTSNDLPPGIYTLSFIIANGGGANVLCGHDGGYSSVNIEGDQKQLVLVTFTKVDSASVTTYLQTANKAVKVYAAKLELGPTQTLAYQDEDGNWQLFETPDYGEELAKCQRYYLPIDTRGKFPAVFSSPSTTLQVFVPTPVTMRVNPTVQGITSISARVYSGAANSQSLSVSQTLLTEAGVLITFSVTWPSTLNPYSCAIVVFGQDGALSAEL